MKLILSWLLLVATVLAGPIAVIVFLAAAFRGLDLPWWGCVLVVWAFIGWAYIANWAIGCVTDWQRDEALKRLKDDCC